MRSASEIIEYFKSGKSHPNEIFEIHDELLKLPQQEVRNALIQTGIGDAIAMNYITAIEMKKKGTWDAYIERWEANKNKTGRERLEAYMKEHGLCMK